MKKETHPQKSQKEDKSGSIIVELLETFMVSFIVLMMIHWFIALPEIVVGSSMEPNIYGGERILVERITKKFKKLERGDIVVLHPPGNDDIDFVKRIVGVPGDVVKILDCNVHVSKDGQRFVLNEPYLSEGVCTSEGPKLREGRSLRLEEGEYIVLGDNRPRSKDSRSFGIIETNRIVGKVVFRFWPFDRLKLF